MINHHAKLLGRSAAAALFIWACAVAQAQFSARLKATLAGHKGSISEIVFSPTGDLLATGGEDNTVRLWDAEGGDSKAVLPLAEKHKLYAVLWSRDGSSLAVISYRGNSGTGQVRIWEARTAQLKTTIELNHRDYLTGYAWSPDSQAFITASQDGTAKLWDTATGSLKKEFSLADKAAVEVPYRFRGHALLSPDGRLAVRADEGDVALLDTATGEEKIILGEVGRPLAFSPDGRALLTNEYSVPRSVDQLTLWDVATGRRLMRLEALPFGVKTVYWSPTGDHLVVEGYYGMHTRLVDARTGRIIAKLPYDGCAAGGWFSSNGCESFVFSADGRLMLKQKKPLRLWSAETGRLLATLDGADGFARFSPADARTLATRGRDKKTLLLWALDAR